jgi:hypothetical protein
MGLQGWKQISSQYLRAVRYNAIKQELEMSFKDGGYETYFGVPPNTFESFITAANKDQYHQNHILKHYPAMAHR